MMGGSQAQVPIEFAMPSDADLPVALTPDGLSGLMSQLIRRGYRLVGPTVRDGVIAYEQITTLGELPQGWSDEQQPAHYRLLPRNDRALFGYAVGPHSWKRHLHPPVLRLWGAARPGTAPASPPQARSSGRLAFFGVRACELQAIAIQDRVFLGGRHLDPDYRARREDTFLVAVNCAVAGGTCFCTSMHAGPKAVSGFDVAMTEVLTEEQHLFIAEAGTDAGRELLGEIHPRQATLQERAAAEEIVQRTARAMGRQMRTDDLPDLLLRNLDHSRWSEVADRCLTCGNCTMVCPTCFCTAVEDATDLAGTVSRSRRWDSCFTMDFSYLHGGSVRQSARSRCRQWMTHKLATWHEQFGSSGCVGCGRCITWCPVGIDITEEVRAIRESERA
jgi:sulfhydrogenase subunit beta (sulfur reductase)